MPPRTHAWVLSLLVVGCVPTEFEDLREQAATVAFETPTNYASTGFGEQVVAYGGTLNGVSASRIGVNAGEDTGFVVFSVFQDDAFEPDVQLDGCGPGFNCDEGAGASLIGLPRWSGREFCLGIPSPTTGEIRFRCEDDVSSAPPSVRGPGGEGLGEASAALPADHPFGRAVLGAPGAGAVYRLPDGATPVRLDLSFAAGVGGRLGRAVAVAALDADSVIIAAGAPVGTPARVVVAVADVAGGGAVTTSVRGCLDASTPGWGGALAIADFDGDGAPDVAVGSEDAEGRLDAVRVFSGADMPAVETCDTSWSAAVELTCPTVDGIACDAGFGTTLAAGDLDADGRDDLIVGTPGAEVEGVATAGAVFVFGGGPTLSELSARAAVLTHSLPTRSARLGASLAVAPGLDGRGEPIVGAPGEGRVYAFLCSGLDGDSEASMPQMRCQPR